MGYILCTAEKPSVAGDIAKVIGANKRCNGYYEGNGYRVTWAVGHLVGLAEPEAYGFMSKEEMWDRENPQNKQEALKELPLIPEEFKLIVLESTKEQYTIVKNLMNDPECEGIIDCGDAGAEGHILQWFIRQKAGCKKPVKRFIATSMTEEAITAAMNDLQDINKYTPIIRGEYCKKKLDWIMGMSMSRGASITYDARVDVGRVQSPTLYFVVKRYLDVAAFKQKDFYTLQADMPGKYSVYWKKDNQNLLGHEIKDEENRLIDKAAADKIADELRNAGSAEVIVFETKNKATDRPQLYDITELERDGNRIYGYTAEEVLSTAQSLYEKHKITTYPRTDSRYITHDLAPFLKGYISQIAAYPKYKDVCSMVLAKELNLDNKVVDDSKVTDHHAIIVTDKIGSYDLSQLTEIEKNVLDLIITRMLVAVSEKFKYKETTLKIKFPNEMIFGASGKIPISQGWKEIQNKLMRAEPEEETGKEEEQIFPELKVGQIVNVNNVIVTPKKTTPPKLHTEATLLTAMENAGNSIEGGAILKGRGIGTQATRANIIKQLFEKGYVTNQQKGKTKYLVPTKQGISVIKVLPPDLYSPKITADWENQIAEIVNGTLTEDEFMERSKSFLRDKLNLILNNKVEGVDFSTEKEAFGKCPWCKSPVYEGTFMDKDKKVESVYCSSKECKFSIRKDNLLFKMRTGKNLTNTQLKKLVAGEQIEVKCVSKTNTTYKGIFSVKKNDKGYADLVFTMPSNKKSAGKRNPFAPK